eukprot:CAMPEP_0197826666 /NCGR_PEP_ID=MMETSP1437-20131217/3591_1 /TAXON_ID=49252 ORGANISM="Eucampia antarctica, Strain CCMP1452" /NCGR_SAMPLE_ID=MMETSP1437 /ASSEMBLY_ACC=CAM_ASM_001096 /LENGTH=611 /DNA_ID=CAMNT_0043427195 /DNA_START=140 /DNA_END=1975 /DNA_ORIENTATION=-
MKHWYTRYASYPPYCSTPDEMASRTVPPMTTDVPTKLLHVTTIIRHGARTPYRVVDCWDGFWKDGSDTAKWDCELKTMMSPPAPPEITSAENNNNNAKKEDPELAGEGSMFLFEKRYDGLTKPLKNIMNGTCQMGQLLLRGYVQELENGRILNSAYLKSTSNSKYAHDERLTLFDVTTATDDEKRLFYQEPNFYYRADDDQRTLMSGQVLLRGLFRPITQTLTPIYDDSHNIIQEDPVVVLHTADKSRDILSPNHKVCPRLTELSEDCFKSEEFQTFNSSNSAKQTRQLMEQNLGKNFEYDGLDCLMTTICTDRKLPDILNDYNDTTIHDQKPVSHVFKRVADLSAKSFLFPMIYNDGAYAKLAMAPLWFYIMKNILPFSSESSSNDGPKLALFSGHDTTIMPILASLGKKLWNGIDLIPYASMLMIEIHEILDDDNNGSDASLVLFPTKRAFRVLYNGKILTSKVDGCPVDSEICDLSILMNRIQSFATNEPDCTTQKQQQPNNNHPSSSASKDVFVTFDTSTFFYGTICLCLLSCILSSVGTFYYLTNRLPFCHTKRVLYQEAKSQADDNKKYVDDVTTNSMMENDCDDKKRNSFSHVHSAVEVTSILT